MKVRLEGGGEGRRDVLFVSAGDHHLLHHDLAGPRDFDVIVAWYGSDEEVAQSLRPMADRFVPISGGKLQNLWTLWRSGELRLDHYDSVLVADDDLALTPRQVTELFRRRRALDACILTPARSRWGAFSFPALLYRPWWDHHFTNFIEVGTPVFRRDALVRFLEEFDGSLAGWGIDHWYMNVLDDAQYGRFVVDHSVTFVNPRVRTPTGGREIERLGTDAQRRASWHRVRDERALREIEPAVLHAVLATPWQMICRTTVHLGLMAAWVARHPSAVLRFARRMSPSLRRLAWRR